MEDRRGTDRRVDPNAWSDEHTRRVRLIYGLVVGGVLVVGGMTILLTAVLTERLGWISAGVGGGVVLLGLVASMPSVFMPVLSAVLKKIPWGRVADNGDITRALPRLVDDEE